MNGMPPELLLEARSLTKKYVQRRFPGRTRITVAVDNVTLPIDKGSAMALVGASGSGKSTLVRCLLGLEKPTSGGAFYRGADISMLAKAQAIQLRRRVHLVFQDVAAAFNPHFTAAAAVAEPLKIAGIGTSAQRRMQAVRWMGEVHLLPEMADRPALEFSGGERQRLAIARGAPVEGAGRRFQRHKIEVRRHGFRLRRRTGQTALLGNGGEAVEGMMEFGGSGFGGQLD